MSNHYTIMNDSNIENRMQINTSYAHTNYDNSMIQRNSKNNKVKPSQISTLQMAKEIYKEEFLFLSLLQGYNKTSKQDLSL